MDHVQYGFHTRFEDGPGTNPEELIGAAHAGCFTMALSGILAEAGMTAKNLATTATVTLDKVDGAYAITAVHLDLVATIPGADQKKFDEAALKAKLNCPVSKLLNAEITLDAQLEA
jgi:osmotically inducible protein OsmC